MAPRIIRLSIALRELNLIIVNMRGNKYVIYVTDALSRAPLILAVTIEGEAMSWTIVKDKYENMVLEQDRKR